MTSEPTRQIDGSGVDASEPAVAQEAWRQYRPGCSQRRTRRTEGARRPTPASVRYQHPVIASPTALKRRLAAEPAPRRWLGTRT